MNKKIPLAVIGALISYAIAGLLWGKGIDSDVKTISKRVDCVEVRMEKDRDEYKESCHRLEFKIDEIKNFLMKK